MNLRTNLHQTLSEYTSLKKVEHHKLETEEELKESYDELKRLEKKVKKEFDDIERLEGLSVKGLFYKVLGSKEEQIEQERQEYLQAALKLKEFRKKVELIEYELEVVESKLIELPKVEDELESLKRQREKQLIASNELDGQKLRDLMKKMDSLVVIERETAEAKNAGENALNLLNSVISSLRKAQDWGRWDMGSKGRMSGYQKRAAMDRAQNFAHNANRALQLFQTELNDIGDQHFDFDIHIQSINSFLDIFFDNLISDWIIQSKIKNSLTNVNQVRDTVIRVLNSLDAELKEIEKEYFDLDSQKEKIVLK